MKLEIREQKQGNKTVFRIFVDGNPTDGVASTPKDAQNLLTMQLRALGRPAAIAPVVLLKTPSSTPKLIQTAPIIRPSGTKGSFPAGGVMLAQTYTHQFDPTGWWMSEKYEGIRAYWTGYELLTRERNRINAPNWFLSFLPAGEALDGELLLGRGKFEETLSVVSKSHGRDPRWESISYMVFDAPEQPGGCEARWAAVEAIVKAACKADKRCPLRVAPQTRCVSKTHLEKVFEAVVADDGEGVMLRKAGSPYQQTRSKYLFKYKAWEEEEAKVTGYERGKTSGVELGAYVAKLLKTGIEFKVDARHLGGRTKASKLPVGTVITVRFQRYTGSGKPYSPRIIAVRDYE